MLITRQKCTGLMNTGRSESLSVVLLSANADPVMPLLLVMLIKHTVPKCKVFLA